MPAIVRSIIAAGLALACASVFAATSEPPPLE